MKRFKYILISLLAIGAISCEQAIYPEAEEHHSTRKICVLPEIPALKSTGVSGDIYAYLFGPSEKTSVTCMKQYQIENGKYLYVVPDTITHVLFSNISDQDTDFQVTPGNKTLTFLKKGRTVLTNRDVLAAQIEMSSLPEGEPLPVELKRLNAKLSCTLEYKDEAGNQLNASRYVQDATLFLPNQAQSITFSLNSPDISDQVLPGEAPGTGSTPDTDDTIAPGTNEPLVNQLQNGSFESPVTEGLGEGWQQTEGQNLFEIGTYPACPARTGEKVLKVEPTEQDLIQYRKTFKVQKNSYYRFSYWLWCDHNLPWNNFLKEPGECANDSQGDGYFAYYGPNQWKLVYKDYYTGDSEELTIGLSANQYNQDVPMVLHTIYIDDMAFYKVSAVGKNLVQNGSMEEVDGNMPSHWELYDLSHNAFARADDQVSHSGKRSLRVAPDKPETTIGVISRKFELDNQLPYIMEGWIRVSRPNTGLSFFLKKYNQAIHTLFTSIEQTDTWIPFKKTLLFKGSGLHEKFKFSVHEMITFDNAEVVHLDDISVYQMTDPKIIYEQSAPTTKAIRPMLVQVNGNKLNMNTDELIMPTAKNKENTVELCLQNKSGEWTRLSKTISYPFEPNKHYQLNLVIRMNETNASMTIEDIVIKDIDINI